VSRVNAASIMSQSRRVANRSRSRRSQSTRGSSDPARVSTASASMPRSASPSVNRVIALRCAGDNPPWGQVGGGGKGVPLEVRDGPGVDDSRAGPAPRDRGRRVRSIRAANRAVRYLILEG